MLRPYKHICQNQMHPLKVPNRIGFTGIMADIADRPRARLYNNYG